MNAGRLSFAAMTLMFLFGGVAAAGEPGPPVESETAPDDDESQPSVDAPSPGEGLPPVQTMPVAPPVAANPADTETGFGFAGQITISDDLQLAATQVSYDFQGQTTKRTQIGIRPALDFFPIANLSIGGQLILGYSSLTTGGVSTSRSELGVLARIGYTFAVGSSTSIWPRVAFGYDHPSDQSPTVPGATDQNLTFQVYVPIVYQPVPHFFIGGGPIISTQIYAKMNDADAPKATALGLQSTLGGCFRGM